MLTLRFARPEGSQVEYSVAGGRFRPEVAQRRAVPPFLPPVAGPLDTSRFHPDAKPVASVAPLQPHEASLFDGF